MLDNHYQPINCIFDIFSEDFAGLLRETKRTCRYISMSVEHMIALINARSTAGYAVNVEISFFNAEIVNQFGSPVAIQTDQGPPFLLAGS